MRIKETNISDQLSYFHDTCNVYALQWGSVALLVDFGSGAAVEALARRGVSSITDILMTHHHRDQGQGLESSLPSGAHLWVPSMEQDLFQNVDVTWQSSDLFTRYNVRQQRFSLLNSVAVHGLLPDYRVLPFGPSEAALSFTIIPTPGHTPGSLSLLADIDGYRMAFTGDIIASPGKLWSLAATQWSYAGVEGVAATIASLLDLKDRRPDVLLPSHGDPIWEPAAAIDLLVDRLWQLLVGYGKNLRLFQWHDQPYECLTPHLLRNRTSLAYAYVLLSQSGKALFIDFGYDFMTGMAPGTDRASRRPWLYTLNTLKRDFGVQSIDTVIPTHYHDDHIAGLNLLREVEGTRVWAPENFAEILACPSHYDLPCLWFDPIPVDRTLPMCQPFSWEEYTLVVYPLPGHTRYAAAIYFEVDGQRVLASGDQYQGEGYHIWNHVYQNVFDSSDYRTSAARLRDLQPDLILPGHSDPVWVQPSYLEELEVNGATLERLHQELLPEAIQGFGAGGFGASIHPYHAVLKAGTSVTLSVEIHNPHSEPQPAHLHLVAPAGWLVTPAETHIQLEPCGQQNVEFQVTPPPGVKTERVRIAADLTIGDELFGQQAEALVTVV